MSQERIEGAAKANAIATVTIAAWEARVFSDEAIERAARDLARHRWQDAINVWDSLGQDAKDGFRDQARVVVAALKGDA